MLMKKWIVDAVFRNGLRTLRYFSGEEKFKYSRDDENKVRQFRPLADFDVDLAEKKFASQLRKQVATHVDIFNESVNPLPIVLKRHHLNELHRIQEALFFAIKTIVSNYDRDERIQSVYKFSRRVEHILKLHEGKPYTHIGTYRADVLMEKDSCTARICEINARFPFNGYIITHIGAMNEYMENEFDLDRIEFNHGILESIKQEFDLTKPIGILKQREPGADVHFVHELIPNTLMIKPNELCVDPTTQTVYVESSQNSNRIYLRQFLLELHQDELLALPDDLLNALVKRSDKLVNDLRTIFIVHDKRFLTILNRDDIISDYLSPNHHETLRKHRIRSILPSDLCHVQLRHEVYTLKNNWLLKPCLLGKGEGIVFGKDLPDREWRSLVEKNLHSNKFILQEYITQERFDLMLTQKQYKDNGHSVRLPLVGALLCLNDKFLGPGIYRASNRDLVALSRGGFCMFPRLEREAEPRLPNDFKIFDSIKPVYENHKPMRLSHESLFDLCDYSFRDVPLYERALSRHGVALISLKFTDVDADFFLTLIKSLNLVPLAHTAKGDDYVWHVRPSQMDQARSHSPDLFAMHTDASFERYAPRYVGLQVLKADAPNGAQTLLLHVDDILEQLSVRQIDLLKSVPVRFKIPDEFRKNDHITHLQSTILSPGTDLFNHTLIRYRADIIEPQPAQPEYQQALHKLESLVDINKSQLIKYFQLAENQLLLIDNSRWLHGRTKISDMNRHLIRVRFQTKDKLMLPWL